MRLISRAGAVALAVLLASVLTTAGADTASAATCSAPRGAHCLSIVNHSDGGILSWRLMVYNSATLKYDTKNCLLVSSPVTNSAGKKLSYANIHLTEGGKFLLHSYLDRRDCGGDMWAGQGWTVGRGDKNNYTVATFTASNPGGLF